MKKSHHTLHMDLQMVMFEFLRPVALGTGAVLAGLALLGWRIPRRANISARPFRRD